ncbi:hypothetical protein Y032_0043g782 [Ancylostoma ceylanicum]|uniref:Uncharacterized protein n=1 Tax=Ancylostoma ceylanicum TaxID=53326 RepID=A0A016UF98_9BILA|nr:hypothetical protein Y032_0043g782 [Ancylostoma ceylanicum]
MPVANTSLAASKRGGMRWTRSHDRAMVVFIFCSCCVSLNVLFSKIRRILEIRELERTSEREAEIVSLIYYNSTVAGGTPSLYLLIQSEDGLFPGGAYCESRNGSSHNKNKLSTVPLGSSNVLIGICETAEEPLYASLHIDDFRVIARAKRPRASWSLPFRSLLKPLQQVLC